MTRPRCNNRSNEQQIRQVAEFVRGAVRWRTSERTTRDSRSCSFVHDGQSAADYEYNHDKNNHRNYLVGANRTFDLAGSLALIGLDLYDGVGAFFCLRRGELELRAITDIPTPRNVRFGSKGDMGF
jgi:hypothetical protein